MNLNHKMIAFVHIEKAAGTTLIHTLRRNFFMRYADVRPFSPASQGTFQEKDLRIILKLNPWLKCFGGHSIRPHAGIRYPKRKIEYITVLRDPIRRYVSQYQHWVEKKGEKITFRQFLDNKEFYNFQTRKIAGIDSSDQAMEILSRQFLLCGVMEHFDTFLVLLKHKLKPFVFDPRYEIRNKAIESGWADPIIERYTEEINNRNLEDMRLFAYVRDVLIENEKQKYGEHFQRDLADFKIHNSIFPAPGGKLNIDYLMRKIYYEPLSGIIRRLNKIPAKGSY